MNVLRNQFLNTASFLSAAPNDAATGKSTTLNEDVGAEDDAGAGENDPDAGKEAGQDAGGEGDDAGGEGAGDESGDGEGADEDDDPDLADLTPEQRKKVKDRIEKETGWRDRQLNKLYARRRAADEDVVTATTIAGRQPAMVVDPNRKFTSDEVKTEAARLAAQTQYDNDCNAAFAAGQKAYADKWGGVLNKLPRLGGVDFDSMVDILATDQPHVVLFSLTDPDTYERVMALPPARRRNEFVKLSLQSAPKARQESQRPGNQPPPPRTLQGGRRVAAQGVDLHDDKVADDVWYAERDKTRRKKFTTVA